MNSRLDAALAAFDAYNKADPNLFFWDDQPYPREWFLSLRLHEWVLGLRPDAREPLLLASRCQHIGRWEIPRVRYPDGRAGYLAWRKDLMHHHADKAERILRDTGYEDDTVSRVRAILLKRSIKQDDEVQVMENALCLVFLQYQYEAFRQENAGRIVEILRKSLLKMDQAGRSHALTLDYTPEGRASVEQALAALETGGPTC